MLHPRLGKRAVEEVLRREMLGSTAIGRGVAIPHATVEGLKSMVGAVARIPHGIEFDSVDGKPVHIVFLLVSPSGGETLRALKSIAQQLQS